MNGDTPVRKDLTATLTAASGHTYLQWPAEALLGNVKGISGGLTGVVGRWRTGGGWTPATLRIRVYDADASFVTPGSYAADPASYPDDILLFDSGAIVPTPSATVADIQEAFDPQLFSAGLLIAVTWTTSAGAGTSTVAVTLAMEVAAP
jgi:hypothetical protein